MNEAELAETAKVMLLKSIAIIVESNLDDRRKLQAISAVLTNLDAKVMASNWRALVQDSTWLIDQAKRG
jgi:hypothetical protein